MHTYTTKYDLWLALSMTPEEYKTEKILELEKELNDSIKKPGFVWIDIREEW